LELPGVEFIRGDITDYVAVRKGITGCDRVCHLAAVSCTHASSAEAWRVNRDGTRHVLQAAYELRVASVVPVSSVVVLGRVKPGELADETRPVNPAALTSLYQRSKAAGDELAREYAAKGLPVKQVYTAFGYGAAPRVGQPGFAEQALLQMAGGKPVARIGNGKSRISLTHTRDLALGIGLAHEHGRAGEAYILSSENLTLPEAWAILAEIVGKAPPAQRQPLWLARTRSSLERSLTGESLFAAEFYAMLADNWNFNGWKARVELGWQPRTFQEGMAQVWAEWQGRAAAPERPALERALRRA
jgi:nucleoside-diphosphate-sugar epimerase